MEVPRTPQQVLKFVAKARKVRDQRRARDEPELVMDLPNGKRIGVFDAETDELFEGMETLAKWQLGRLSTAAAIPILDRMFGFPPDMPSEEKVRILQRSRKASKR